MFTVVHRSMRGKPWLSRGKSTCEDAVKCVQDVAVVASMAPRYWTCSYKFCIRLITSMLDFVFLLPTAAFSTRTLLCPLLPRLQNLLLRDTTCPDDVQVPALVALVRAQTALAATLAVLVVFAASPDVQRLLMVDAALAWLAGVAAAVVGVAGDADDDALIVAKSVGGLRRCGV
jgi:hypothetical protein